MFRDNFNPNWAFVLHISTIKKLMIPFLTLCHKKKILYQKHGFWHFSTFTTTNYPSKWAKQNIIAKCLWFVRFVKKKTSRHQKDKSSESFVSVITRGEGYTVKYNLSPREIRRAEPDLQGLRLYLTVYPVLSHNTDNINF